MRAHGSKIPVHCCSLFKTEGLECTRSSSPSSLVFVISFHLEYSYQQSFCALLSYTFLGYRRSKLVSETPYESLRWRPDV
jgi:hypothetical protein